MAGPEEEEDLVTQVGVGGEVAHGPAGLVGVLDLATQDQVHGAAVGGLDPAREGVLELGDGVLHEALDLPVLEVVEPPELGATLHEPELQGRELEGSVREGGLVHVPHGVLHVDALGFFSITIAYCLLFLRTRIGSGFFSRIHSIDPVSESVELLAENG